MLSNKKGTLAIAAVAVMVVFAVGRGLIATPVTEPLVTPPERHGEGVVEVPAVEAAPVQDASKNTTVSYAIALPELHGLPPQAAPGTELEIWVAWEPPVTEEPKIHRLLESVILEEIAPPLLPDGPHVAMLLVPRKGLSDLLYGDRYGALSVAIPQRPLGSG